MAYGNMTANTKEVTCLRCLKKIYSQNNVNIDRLKLTQRQIDQIAFRLKELDQCIEIDLALARLDKASPGDRLIDILPDDICQPELEQIRQYIIDFELFENIE
jgi:hypothetical protein